MSTHPARARTVPSWSGSTAGPGGSGKANIQSKPRAFNEHGYLLVSVNYQFHPAVTYKEQAGDIAQAVRWVHDHAGEYGGDPGRLFLMGHSSGAYLAALGGTDDRYLKKAGLTLSDLSGVILLDGAR